MPEGEASLDSAAINILPLRSCFQTNLLSSPQTQIAACRLLASVFGFVPSFINLYSTESTSARQLASTILAETPTVPHCFRPSVEVISTRTRLAVPDKAPMTRTL